MSPNISGGPTGLALAGARDTHGCCRQHLPRPTGFRSRNCCNPIDVG